MRPSERAAAAWCRLFGHAPLVPFRQVDGARTWTGSACPRCLLVVSLDPGTRAARRRRLFGR